MSHILVVPCLDPAQSTVVEQSLVVLFGPVIYRARDNYSCSRSTYTRFFSLDMIIAPQKCLACACISAGASPKNIRIPGAIKESMSGAVSRLCVVSLIQETKRTSAHFNGSKTAPIVLQRSNWDCGIACVASCIAVVTQDQPKPQQDVCSALPAVGACFCVKRLTVYHDRALYKAVQCGR